MADEKLRPPPGLVPDPQVLPSPDGASIDAIRPGSAMAVVGVFVEVVRSRFGDGTLPWVYNGDIKKTGIAIESAFNEDAEHRNKRPAIFIDRDEQVIGRSVIGDFAGQNLKTGLRGFWGLESMPILIECIAAKKGESAIIGDLTRIFLHASSDLIQAAFGFHEMTPVTCGRTQPSARDKNQWTTPVTFSVQYNLRWTNKGSGPLIAEIITKAKASGCSSATEYFELVALPDDFPK